MTSKDAKPWKKIYEKEAERWCQGIVELQLGFSFRIESCVGLGIEVQVGSEDW